MDYPEGSTVIDRLRHWVDTRPDDAAFIFVQNRHLHDETASYRALWERIGSIAATLMHQGCQRGDRVLLIYPSGLEYIAAFFACLAAGAIAVPVYPPASEQHLERLRKIIGDCRPAAVLSQASESLRLGRLFEDLGGASPRLCCTDGLLAAPRDLPAPVRAEARDVAFLQYTSGSTGQPKGVVVTHGNLSANQRFITRACSGDSPGVGLGWLPLYHDMGLIGCVIQSVFWGHPYVFMSPLTFMQHPVAWLRAITKYRAVRSGAPNFAYELCAGIRHEQLEGIDLALWRVAFCGAEQIRHPTLLRFAERFAPVGFDARSFFPCYGLAEATLFVSGSKAEDGLRLHVPDSDGHSRCATAHQGFVGCGAVAPELDVRIVDPETCVGLPMGQVGEVWVRGENVAQGYWQQPELNRRVFDARLAAPDEKGGGYLRTGDLGFLSDGELVIAGRLKEVLIVAGRNLYPQDIEILAEAQSTALRPGHTAAVMVDGEGTDGLAIVAEVSRTHRNTVDLNDLAGRIVAAVVNAHGVAPRQVVFLPPGAQLKTSSGKLRRTEIGRLLAAGSLAALHAWPGQASATVRRAEGTAGAGA